MGRRCLTVLLACAATAAAAPLPASAQAPASSATPGAVSPTTGSPASSALPATTAAPATTVPPATSAAPATSGTPATSAVPGGASQTPGAAKDDSTGPLILLALVGALLLLTAALWGAARWWAWEPTWWIRSRHATAEAGWRTSAAWAEFRDWLRLGR